MNQFNITNLIEWLQNTGINPITLKNLILSFVIILVIWLVRRFIIQVIHDRFDDSFTRYQWQKTSGYLSVLLIIVLVGPMWLGAFRDTATYFGLLSAGLAIALQSLIVNFAGWLFIMLRHPFQVGDRIEIGEHCGDVLDIRIFQSILMEVGNWVDADQSTGRIIYVPNGNVFSQTIASYSQGFHYIWNEIPVLVTFESNWEKAKQILTKIANERSSHLSKSAHQQVKKASRNYMLYYSNLTPIVYTNVKDSGVMLTIRYLCEPKYRRDTAQDIWEDILRAFACSDDIDFAYPTQRFYFNRVEGKPGTVPDTDSWMINQNKNGLHKETWVSGLSTNGVSPIMEEWPVASKQNGYKKVSHIPMEEG